MIRLVDGPLYQWDTGRLVSTVAREVHFAADGGSLVLCVLSADGLCRVPDELLACGSDIMAFEADGAGRTLSRTRLRVDRRPKPPDWAFTPTEAESIKTLKAWVDERLSQAGGGDYAAAVNKPRINGIELAGDVSLSALGIGTAGPEDVDSLFSFRKDIG